MKKSIVLDILKAIKNLLCYNDISSAKEYIQLEIDNLQGNTPLKCKTTFSKSYFYYCNKCSNKNCPDNRNLG